MKIKQIWYVQVNKDWFDYKKHLRDGGCISSKSSSKSFKVNYKFVIMFIRSMNPIQVGT